MNAALTADTAAPARSSRWSKVGLLLTVLLAAGLRILFLTSQSLTADEVTDLDFAHQTPAQIFNTPDGFPPLYNLVLHWWLKLDPSIYAGRILGALFGVLAVVVVWQLGRRVGGPGVALCSALALSVSPIHIWYSQEGRAYGLYILAAAVAILAMVRALDTDRPADWAWYVAACVVGLWIHYYFALLIGTGVLISLVERRSWQGIRKPIVAHLAIALASLPLITLVLPADLASEQASAYHVFPGAAAAGYVFLSFVAGHAVGPSLRELHILTARQALPQALPWLIAAGAIAVILVRRSVRELSRDGRGVRRMLLLCVAPVVTALVAARVTGVAFEVRHVVWAVVPLVVLLGAGAAQAREAPVALVAGIGFCALAASSIYHRETEVRYRNEDVAALARYLHAHSPPGTPVYVTPSYMARAVDLYLGDEATVRYLPRWNDTVADPAATLRSLQRRASRGTPFWVVYTRPFHADPGGRLLAAMRASPILAERAGFAGILVFSGSRLGGAAPATSVVSEP